MQARNSALCGSTCFGYHHVHEKLKGYVLNQRRRLGSDEVKELLFMVHFDLSSCYDSMLPGKLMQLLKSQVLVHVSYV